MCKTNIIFVLTSLKHIQQTHQSKNSMIRNFLGGGGGEKEIFLETFHGFTKNLCHKLAIGNSTLGVNLKSI